MRGNRLLLGSLVCGLLALPATAAITSHFDSGDDGWFIADVPGVGNYATLLNFTSADFNAAGGHPGGYISALDPSNNTFMFQAPPSFAGDQSAYLGGSLNFSLKTGTNNWDSDRVVALVGTNGLSIIAPIAVPAPVDTWVDYSIPLQASSFVYNGLGGAPVSAADFLAVLSDVAALRISAEFATPQVEVTGLDNVELVPEPTTLGLVLLAMAAGRRRMSHSARPR